MVKVSYAVVRGGTVRDSYMSNRGTRYGSSLEPPLDKDFDFKSSNNEIMNDVSHEIFMNIIK